MSLRLIRVVALPAAVGSTLHCVRWQCDGSWTRGSQWRRRRECASTSTSTTGDGSGGSDRKRHRGSSRHQSRLTLGDAGTSVAGEGVAIGCRELEPAKGELSLVRGGGGGVGGGVGGGSGTGVLAAVQHEAELALRDGNASVGGLLEQGEGARLVALEAAAAE